MKRIYITTLITVLITLNISAQEQSAWRPINRDSAFNAYYGFDSIPIATIKDTAAYLFRTDVINNVYPNPATSGTEATLEFNLSAPAQVIITINSAFGRQMDAHYKGELSTGNYLETLPLDGYTNGLYYINIWINERVITQQININ